MKVQIHYVTELHGSVEKKIFKAGTTARTYKIDNKVRWISIGKRNNRKRPYKKTQLLRAFQMQQMSRFYRRLGVREKQYYQNLAEQLGITTFAAFCKENIPKDRAYIYSYARTTVLESYPDEGWWDDACCYIVDKIGEEHQAYLFVDDNYIPEDVDPSKFKLVFYIWASRVETEEATIQIYRVKDLNIPIQEITWNNQPPLEETPTTEVTLYDIPVGEDLDIRVEADISTDIEKFQKGEIEHIWGWKLKSKEVHETETIRIYIGPDGWYFPDVNSRIEIEL